MAWLNYDLQDAFPTCPFVEILSHKHHTGVQLDQVDVSSCASSTCPALQSLFHTLHKSVAFHQCECENALLDEVLEASSSKEGK